MSEKIEKLTPEQEAMLEVYREKYLALGRDTTPIDFEKAKKIVEKVYTLSKLTPPPEYIYCTSPKDALKKINEKEGNKEFKYYESTLEGQHWAHWIAFFSFFHNELGVDCSEAEGLFETIDLGWLYFFDEAAFICDKPCRLELDENGKLHSEDHKAFEYSDGWGACYWHGQLIPDWVILEKEKISFENIIAEKNKEVQRCMMEIYRNLHGDVLFQENGTLIHQDDWGKLWEIPAILDAFDKPVRYLEVENFSPNETAYLTKPEIDEIVLKVQKGMPYNGMLRHGDVVLVSKNAKETTREEAETYIKKFRSEVKFEIELLMRKKSISGDIKYKKYWLQIKPEINTAYEAWQSCHRHLKVSNFLPFVAS